MSNKKEEFFDFVEKAKQLLIDGKDEILRSSKIGKLLLDVAALNREKQQIFKTIGEKLSKLDRSKLSLPSNLEPLFHKAEELEKKIEVQEELIEELKKKSASD